MSNNYSEQIFQSIDTIISQRLNEVSFDKTEICEIISQDKNDKRKYLVSNGSLKYEAYSDDENRSYLNNQKVYVRITNGDYSLRKIITGSYAADETNENLYVNPFNHLVTSSTLSLPNSIWAKVNSNEYDDWDDIPTNDEKPNSAEYLVSFSYKNTKDFDYIGLDFAFKTNIVGYQGSYALKLSFWNSDEELTNADDNSLIISSKDLYGNPYNLNETLRFQHLFPWPKREKDGKLESISPTEITKIKLQLIQDNKFLTKQGDVNVNTDTWIQLVKADLKFGYDVASVTEDKLELILKEGESLRYTTGDENIQLEDEMPAAARNLYLSWNHIDTSGITHIFNIDQLPNIFEYYNVYWLHYVDGLGKNKDLPDEYSWNWKTITNNTNLAQDIILTTLYRTDQYKVVIEYKYKDNETVYYSESTGLVFDNRNVAAEPGSSNNSEDSLRLSLEPGDNGIYNLYGLDGRAVDGIVSKSRTITANFLDATSWEDEKIEYIKWDIPQNNTMINAIIPLGIDKQRTINFTIKQQYLPGMMNNRIRCEVKFKSGEIRRGSLTLQFGEISTAGSNYAFNIDFMDNRTCLYAIGNKDTVKIKATFTKSNGEAIEIPEINWSWLYPNGDYHLIMSNGETISSIEYTNPIEIELIEDDNTIVQLSYNSNEVLQNNYAILMATIENYALENSLTTNLIAYLPIPIAKLPYTHIAGATRLVYDSNGNNLSYSKDNYKLYSEEIQEFNIFWEISPNSEITVYDNQELIGIKRIEGNNGEEVTLCPLSYCPKNPPATCIFASNLEGVVWSQPILIIQNRWEFDLLNSWNGKLESDGESYILSPLLGAGKKENNTFTGVLIGDLTKAEGKNEQTGLYGFKEGLRRFSFNDKGEAYIGTGDYYIDFDSENLIIKVKNFELNANYMKISSADKIISIYKDETNLDKDLRVKLGLIKNSTYGLDVYEGAFRLYGVPYSSTLTDSNAAIYFDSGNMILQGELVKKYQDNYTAPDSQPVAWLDEIKFGEIQRDYLNGASEYRYKGIIIEHKEPINNKYADWTQDHGGIFIGLDNFAYNKSTNRFDGSIILGMGQELIITNSPTYQYSNFSSTYYQSSIDIYPKTQQTTSTSSRPYINLNTESAYNTHNITISTQGGNANSRTAIWGTLEINGKTAIWGTLEINGSPFVNSDLNLKNSIDNLIDEYDILFNNLIPRTYKFNDGTSNRNHIGFIAQEVLEGLRVANIDFNSCAIVGKLDVGTDKEHWALRYEEFIPLNTWQIQKLKARVTELEKEIKEIKQNEIY